MAWNDAPPTKEELATLKPAKSWMDQPPTPLELGIKSEEPGLFGKATSELAGMIPGQIEEMGGLEKAKRGLIRSGLETLPTAGTIAGSIVGGGAGFLSPVPGGAAIGSLTGASAGALAGSALEQSLKAALLDEKPSSTEDYLTKLQQSAIEGAEAEMGGQVTGKALGFLGGKVSKYASKLKEGAKENIQAIKEAAERLGINLPESWLTKNITEQKLEQALAQSPRPPATKTREAYESFKKGMGRVGESLESMKMQETPLQKGEALAQGLKEEVKAAKEPVTELYENVNKSLQQIGLDKKVTNRYIGSLKSDPIFKTADGEAFLNKFQSDIAKQKTVADLKELRSNLLKNITEQTSEIDRLRFEKAYDSLTNLRDATIQNMKNDPFIKAQGKAGQGVVDELAHQLALADAQYASNLKDLESIKGVIGMKGAVKSPGQFIRNIEKIPEEKLIERAANTDVKTIQQFQTKYPALYENAKAAKITDLVKKATDKDGVNVTRFIKNVEKLQPEVKGLLFDKTQQQMLDDAALLIREAPEKLGPSGTPEGIEYIKGLLSPQGWMQDIGARSLQKYRQLVPALEEGLLMKNVPTTFGPQVAPILEEQVTRPELPFLMRGLLAPKGQKEAGR